QSLAERAAAVLTRHFRKLEKSAEVDLNEFALNGKGRLTAIEITIFPGALARKPALSKRALLFGGDEKKDGDRELRKTGRALHLLYPDDLDRATGREREVEELARCLSGVDRRPILLVGPRQVGKTAIVHELAFQICSRKKERFGGGRTIWLVSPMRLISGMSYLGEWENRVLAILDHAQKKDCVLYFDDLLGLFTAGVSAASDLNVAQVLKPVLEKRSVRILAEITPESWRVLRERDRAFADLFQVIPVREPAEAETMRVLIQLTRTLEEQHRCEFDPEVVPVVFDLHRRFGREAAFPGKAAGFLRRLAIRRTGQAIYRATALHEFSERTGVQLSLLTGSADLDREEILLQLQSRLVGQDQVLAAFADILLTLKARLNDPRRPLGTLLLLGPTGVGKTQSAKALAEFLFRSPERLLRFDMNEYVDAAAARRLVGTRQEPEGLLTGAIRRQPFSVVLFDEIEKAAPEVFDMLLAVLDEGRMTDSLGRVADFTNAVILLTSNLGVRESRARLGFQAAQWTPASDDQVYIDAAEKFFRPEFFNRLDRIIPFRALEPAQLADIAERLIHEIFQREGLRRRECILNVAPEAVTRLVELGYHPQLGARSLKRVVERELAQPLARHLAGLTPGAPTIANFGAGDHGFNVELQALRPLPCAAGWVQQVSALISSSNKTAKIHRLIEQAGAALDRIEAGLEANAPHGKIELGQLTPGQARYFACREQLKKVDRLFQAFDRSHTTSRKKSALPRLPKPKPNKLILRQWLASHPRWDRLKESVSLRLELADWEASETGELPDELALALLRELALLEAMVAQPIDDRPLLLLQFGLHESHGAFVWHFSRMYSEFFSSLWGAQCSALITEPQQRNFEAYHWRLREQKLPVNAFWLCGFNLRRLIPGGCSVILMRLSAGSLIALFNEMQDVCTEAEARALLRDFRPEDARRGLRSVGSMNGVWQLMTQGKTLLDFRNGLLVPAQPSPEEFRALLLSALPLPPEIQL
ncbi:MAG: AAA family ATPase, partial [Verrucomicrobiota bacterium]